MSRQFTYTVNGARVQTCGAVGLCLEPDANVLDGRGEYSVSYPGEGAGRVILGVGEGWRAIGLQVRFLEGAARVVETAELDGDAGANTDERGERAFVEC